MREERKEGRKKKEGRKEGGGEKGGRRNEGGEEGGRKEVQDTPLLSSSTVSEFPEDEVG